ncbi:uncharacterized protein V6R79_023429 [Siganus canaliculatus]
MEAEYLDDGRTVVVSGVPDFLPVDRMVDKLTIHFQSRRSRGGDVEVVRYPTHLDRVAFVTFDEAADADRVVKKEEQIMADHEFPQDHLLTVFPFTRDVFFYVSSATVDLAVFGRDQKRLIQSLRSTHRSLRFQALPKQRKARIEGPASAVHALKKDLIQRDIQLKSTLLVQTASFKPKETLSNPRVISHHKFDSPVSCSSSKAKLQPASPGSLSPPLHTAGEASKVHTSLANAKSPNISSRQIVSSGSLAAGSFHNTSRDEEEERAQSRFQMPSDCGTRQIEAKPRQVFREEINVGIRSSLSDLNLLPAKVISAKRLQENDISEKHASPGRASAAKIRGKDHLGSGCSCYLKESDQSSSAVTAKLLQTGLEDVSPSSERKGSTTEKLSSNHSRHPRQTDVWVDSYTYKYIEKFKKKTLDECLRGLSMCVKFVKGNDFVRIVLTETQPSKSGSRIQEVLRDLSALVEFWQSRLRVNQVNYDEEKLPDKQKLIQICDSSNYIYDDVLYLFEGSCIKVIGPSVSSSLFYYRVESELAKLCKAKAVV